MTKLTFHIMILVAAVALAGPVAIDWVTGLTLNVAADTATRITEVSQ